MIGKHNTDTVLSFYNDRVKEIIAANIIAEPFTYVPIKAGHMELVGGNAVVFGKITEGYDVIDPIVETEITYEDVTLASPIVNLGLGFVKTGEVFGGPEKYNNATTYHIGDVVYVRDSSLNFYRCKATTVGNFPTNILYWIRLSPENYPTFRNITALVAIGIPFNIVEGSTYSISVANTEEGIASMTASYIAQPGDTYAEVKAGLEVDLTAKGFEVVATVIPWTIQLYSRSKVFMTSPQYEIEDIPSIFRAFTFAAYILTLGLTSKYAQLKCGAKHGFGIVYKDRAGRTCSVIKNAAMAVYIPFYLEYEGSALGSIVKLAFKISHKAPDWAETYEIVYFGNISMDYFLQIRANNIIKLDYGSDRYSMDILSNLGDTYTLNNRWKVPPYEWRADDRLRLLGTIDDSTGYGAVIGGDFIYDYEIENTGTMYGDTIGGDWLIFQAVEHPTLFDGETNILVEIYRPLKGLANMVAYGTGMVFDIATDQYGNRYHKGDTDQVFSDVGECTTPASVNNTANDCWKFFRLNYKKGTGIIQPFWAESIFPSDWWSNQIIANKLTSAGFPFLDDLSQRKTVLDERIRHGGFLITGTRTNNIAHFTFDDFMDLPKKNGDITGLREVGFTLKVIQMYKETSIYINRIQTFNPDGTEQFTLTDKFLAEQRPMETDYGCQHPDSIMVNGRNLYYWDNSQGAFIRSAPNGQLSLSSPEYKMSRYFKDLIKWVQTTGGGKLLQVRVGANNDFEEVWMTFRMNDDIRGLIFSEKQGRFISRINQITESYVHLGNFFAHLYHQRVWIMNIDEGQDYLSWVGVPTYAEIEVVSNIEPIRNKVYNAVALFSDHELSSLPKYVYIPEEASAGNELMETNIPIWDRREGIFFGEIMKDENSKGNFVSVNDRKMNGNAMRGRYCFIKLMTEEHEEKVKIDSVVIFSTPSERNV